MKSNNKESTERESLHGSLYFVGINRWLFRPKNPGKVDLASSHTPVLLKTLAIFCITAFSLVALFSTFTTIFPGIGVSGDYVRRLDSENGSGERVVEKIHISLDNRVNITTYCQSDGTPMNEPRCQTTKWIVRYESKRPEDITLDAQWSHYVFSFETQNWQSMWQFYYFPNEKKMVEKQNRFSGLEGIGWYYKQ